MKKVWFHIQRIVLFLSGAGTNNFIHVLIFLQTFLIWYFANNCIIVGLVFTEPFFRHSADVIFSWNAICVHLFFCFVFSFIHLFLIFELIHYTFDSQRNKKFWHMCSQLNHLIEIYRKCQNLVQVPSIANDQCVFRVYN